MAFRVELTSGAKHDLDDILDWLLTHEVGDAGFRWFRRMRESIDSLAEFPRRCAFAPESSAFPFEVRQLLYGRKPHAYRILFTIEGDRVIVLHVRHGRRQRLTHQ